jgi:hypothetical protein
MIMSRRHATGRSTIEIRDLPAGQVLARGRGMLDFNVQSPRQLRETAADLYRRADNIPLGRDGSGLDRMGELRDVADALTALAETQEAASD